MDSSEYFKREAKTIVDMLFETKCFKETITRDNMNDIEKFISEQMDSSWTSYQKLQRITEKVKNLKQL